MTVMLTYNVCVGTCHRSSFVVISSCESQTLAHTPSLSLSHTHTFLFSLCVEERWHLNCHRGEDEVVSRGSRGQPSCRMVFESLENKSCPDEISSQRSGCVRARAAPACAPDVIKMSPSICNMFPLRVSLSGGQSQAAAGSIGAITGAAQPHSSADSLNVVVQRNQI